MTVMISSPWVAVSEFVVTSLLRHDLRKRTVASLRDDYRDRRTLGNFGIWFGVSGWNQSTLRARSQMFASRRSSSCDSLLSPLPHRNAAGVCPSEIRSSDRQ